MIPWAWLFMPLVSLSSLSALEIDCDLYHHLAW
jgi:hypothetical protein